MGRLAKRLCLSMLILASCALTALVFLSSELQADRGDRLRPVWSATDVPAAVAALVETKRFASMDVITIPGASGDGMGTMKAIKAYAFNPAAIRLSKIGPTGDIVPKLKVAPVLEQKAPKVRTSAFPELKITGKDGGARLTSAIDLHDLPAPDDALTPGMRDTTIAGKKRLSAEPQAPALFAIKVVDPKRVKTIPITAPKLAKLTQRIEEAKTARANTTIEKVLPGVVGTNLEDIHDTAGRARQFVTGGAQGEIGFRIDRGTPTRFTIRMSAPPEFGTPLRGGRD
jgi:hypothetical protein